MERDSILPILSGSFANLLIDIDERENNPIITEILSINDAVESFNRIYYMLNDELYLLNLEHINSRITDEVRMVSFRIGVLEVSFLPKGKEAEYNDSGEWSRKNRQSGKPAKIFQKLLKKEFKQSEWEVFSNLLKSEICDCVNFEIVSGEAIRSWYNEENYFNEYGSLGNSCMRYASASDYFDLYVDHAKMLITTKQGLLTGRALVWELGDGITLLDRIYTCDDYLVDCYINYAKEHKWYYRECNGLLSTGCSQHWYGPNDNYACTTCPAFSIKLTKRYDQFPYVDSFRYYHYDTNTISTIASDCYTLDRTDGDYCDHDGETYTCAHCGYEETGYDGEMPDGIHYSQWSDEYYCDDCCWWCEYLNDYIPNSENQVILHCSRWNYTVPDTYIDEHLVSDCDGTEGLDSIVVINDEYYTVDIRTLRFNEETKQYEIRPNS